ncbi:MAG TPA: serine/threonine-protein kinase, partial [Ideonella sp.]|nr:serine/threonine-protein kinase [Ideonella sp.]
PATIDHRGVVKTLDAGQTPDGELYLVMELLVGRSLRAEMQAAPPGLAQVRKIGMELLDVLAAAHARGVIHRDIKPENIFVVQPGGEVKLLDFGITKLLTSGHSVLPRTQAGAMLGTAAYMAPEQLADARTVDARADLWAVGITLYELIAGRRPFRGATVEELLVQLVRGEPDPIRAAYPQATPDLEAFFARALAKDPQQRFASAGEMAQAFARLSSWSPAVTPAAGTPGIAPPLPAAPLATPPAGIAGLATQATGAQASAPQMYGRIKQPSAQTPAAPVVTPLPAPIPYSPATPVQGTPALQTSPGAGSTDRIRARGTPWLLVVAGVLAIVAGAGVVYVVMQGRKHEPPVQPAPQQPPVAVLVTPDAATVAPPPPAIDAAVIAAAGSATSKPASASPAGKPVPRGSAAAGPAPLDPYAGGNPTRRPTTTAPTPPTPPPVETPATDFCDASCKMLASCHLGSRTGPADCAGNPTIHACLVSANGDCNAFAACMFGGYCGQLPAGGHSCSEAMDCESSCAGNQVCVCSCIQGL